MNKIYAICCFLCLVGCFSDKQRLSNWLDEEKSNEEFQKMTPRHFNDKEKMLLRNLQQKVGLDSLDGGYVGMQIRIFANSKNSDSARIYVFSKQKNDWQAHIHDLFIYFNFKTGVIDSVQKISYRKFPRSGWEKFSEYIFSSNIFSLPDYSEIENYHVPTDAKNVFIEIASRSKYKIYFYPGLTTNIEACKEAKEFSNILQHIDNEFGSNQIW